MTEFSVGNLAFTFGESWGTTSIPSSISTTNLVVVDSRLKYSEAAIQRIISLANGPRVNLPSDTSAFMAALETI